MRLPSTQRLMPFALSICWKALTNSMLYCTQLEQLFSSGFSLQAEDAADHFSKAAAAAAAAQQGQQMASDLQPTALPSSSHPPMDWSIKSAVRFWSPEPFTVAEEATCASASTGTANASACCCCNISVVALEPLKQKCTGM